MININRLLEGERTEITSIRREADSNFVKQFRKKHNMTQAHFAFVMGVKKKTVEKWESGTNKVNGSSALLLNLLDQNPEILDKIYSVKHYKAGEKSEYAMAPTFIEHTTTQKTINIKPQTQTSYISTTIAVQPQGV